MQLAGGSRGRCYFCQYSQRAGGSRGRCYFSQCSQQVAQEVAAISVSIVSGWLKRSLLFQLVYSQSRSIPAQLVQLAGGSRGCCYFSQCSQWVAQEVAAISVNVVSGWLKRSLLFQLVQLAGGSRSRCYFSQYSQRVAQEVAAISVSIQLEQVDPSSVSVVSGWLKRSLLFQLVQLVGGSRGR